jgi:hypothetical protein
MNKLLNSSLLLLALSTKFIYAAHPFNTDDAGVIPDRSFEIEACGGSDFHGNADAGLAVKYGIDDRFDLGITNGALFPSDVTFTFTRPEIGLKFALIPDRFTLSAGSSLAEHNFSMIALLSGGITNTAFHLNAGFASDEETPEQFVYAGSVHQSIKAFSLGAELIGNHLDAPSWQIGVCYCCNLPLTISSGIAGSFVSWDELRVTVGLTLLLEPRNIIKKEDDK